LEFLPEGHEDVRMIRERVQDGGVNLYILRLPLTIAGSEVKVVAAGYYPDELHQASWSLCDDRQHSDWQDGRMVILKTLQLQGTFSVAYARDMSDYNPANTAGNRSTSGRSDP
jgi:hypothetical protein